MTTHGTTEDLIAKIEALMAVKSLVVVAIDGRSGVGKSSVSAMLAERLGAAVIDQDDFYAVKTHEEWRALSVKERASQTIDWKRVRSEVLAPLKNNKQASWYPYDWDMGALADSKTVCEPAPVVVLEGTYSARPELADMIDVSCLLTLPEDERMRRIKKREGQYYDPAEQAMWGEAEDYYFAEVCPPDWFDLIVNR